MVPSQKRRYRDAPRGGEELCWQSEGRDDTIAGSPKKKYANTLQNLEKGREMVFL